MDSKPDIKELTRRERQIMEIIYRRGNVTAVDVMNDLPGEPVNATVRTMLNVLEEKGFLRHETSRGRYIYFPTIPLKKARRTALEQVMKTFFKGAEASAVISILKESEAELTDEEIEVILDLIKRTREEGR